MSLTVLWLQGHTLTSQRVFIFDFIYKRYIDETVCITPVYLKISDKTREKNCRALSIVKSMQISEKRKQIQVRSCRGYYYSCFLSDPTHSDLLRWIHSPLQVRNIILHHDFFPWCLLYSVSLIHPVLIFSFIHTTESLWCTMVPLKCVSTLWQWKNYARSTETVFWTFIFTGFSVYFLF